MGIPLLFTGEFGVVIMIDVVTEEMHPLNRIKCGMEALAS
jgi:hypothetical protein